MQMRVRKNVSCMSGIVKLSALYVEGTEKMSWGNEPSPTREKVTQKENLGGGSATVGI